MKKNILVSGLPFSGTTVIGLSLAHFYKLSYFHEPFSAKPSSVRFRVASEEWFLNKLNSKQLRAVRDLSCNPSIKQLFLNMSDLSNTIHLSHYKLLLTSGISKGALVKDPNLLNCSNYFYDMFTRILCVKSLNDQIRSFVQRDFRLTREQYNKLAKQINYPREWRNNQVDDIVLLLNLLDHNGSNFDYWAVIKNNVIHLCDRKDHSKVTHYQISTKTDLFSLGVNKKMRNKSGVFHQHKEIFSESFIVEVLESYFEQNEKSVYYYK